MYLWICDYCDGTIVEVDGRFKCERCEYDYTALVESGEYSKDGAK